MMNSPGDRAKELACPIVVKSWIWGIEAEVAYH
jgi:hypothetical protein